MTPPMGALLFKTHLLIAIVCGEVAMALSNYSLPFGAGAPYLQQAPFGPTPQLGPRAPSPFAPATPRTPYNPPTYLPPDNERFSERTSSYYSAYNQEVVKSSIDTIATNGNVEYYGARTIQETPRKQTDYRAYEDRNLQQPEQQRIPQPPPQLPVKQPQQQQQQQPQQQQQQQQQEQNFPGRPAGFTKVQSGQNAQGKSQVHAVLDYDDDYYEDETDVNVEDGDQNGGRQSVTPIQGPIFLKNGSVPVVPLYSYPVISNGTFIQIPILWSALSVALGVEVRGQIIRGVPCVKRYHQLFCPTAGSTYPIERIENFIDENKALMKRMYGDFTIYTEYGLPPETAGGGRGKRSAPGVPDIFDEPETGFSHRRKGRQSDFERNRRPNTIPTPPLNQNMGNSTGRFDACESKMEIITPYWALNSAGKVRAVVNTMHFEQAVHQEVCSKTQTNRCSGECGCEQKYKWHRLLAYDPDQDCAGIFMDWFLFPSCCVCRCLPNQ